MMAMSSMYQVAVHSDVLYMMPVLVQQCSTSNVSLYIQRRGAGGEGKIFQIFFFPARGSR